MFYLLPEVKAAVNTCFYQYFDMFQTYRSHKRAVGNATALLSIKYKLSIAWMEERI